MVICLIQLKTKEKLNWDDFDIHKLEIVSMGNRYNIRVAQSLEDIICKHPNLHTSLRTVTQQA